MVTDTLEAFIRGLPALPVPGLPEVLVHTARAGSGMGRAIGLTRGGTPYWAYPWAGGIALARYVLDHPETVRGKRVLDLGAGSGLVGIAAMKAGAAAVTFSDADSAALLAARLNVELNEIGPVSFAGDILGALPGEVDVILAGDAFYSARLARRVAAFLDRAGRAGIASLVGDPGRKPLPLERLEQLAQYQVADFGAAEATARVYAWRTPL